MITMFLTFEHHKKECALAHSRALARSLATCFCFARVRIIGTLVPFCVIGNSKEFPITQKRVPIYLWNPKMSCFKEIHESTCSIMIYS